MDQLDHLMSLTAVTEGKVIQKIITKIKLLYQRDLLGSFARVCLVPKIHFSYYVLNNFTYSNCNYRRHVV